ncbi:sulfate transporter [Xenophilus sp. AP218F]|nr:sulfate transporter [Xenophilus sp. AP218F]
MSDAQFKTDAQGRLVPIDRIKPIDLARDELVADIVKKARVVSADLTAFKEATFSDIIAFIELSAERYGAKVGGEKGNVTLVSYDGRYKVLRAVQETLTFDEGLQAAKALIDECVHEWTSGARSELRALINDAFNVDKAGKISTGRILTLRRLDIEDDKWKRAMAALSDSIRVQCSKSYVRVYERVGDTDRYEAIPLDIANA